MTLRIGSPGNKVRCLACVHRGTTFQQLKAEEDRKLTEYELLFIIFREITSIQKV